MARDDRCKRIIDTRTLIFFCFCLHACMGKEHMEREEKWREFWAMNHF